MVPATVDDHPGTQCGADLKDGAETSSSRAERMGKTQDPDPIMWALQGALVMPALLKDC